MDGHQEVDSMLAVEELVKGAPACSAYIRGDVQIGLMFVADKCHLHDLSFNRLALSHRLVRGYVINFLGRGTRSSPKNCTNFAQANSTNSGTTGYHRSISSMRATSHFHSDAVGSTAMVTLHLTSDEIGSGN